MTVYGIGINDYIANGDLSKELFQRIYSLWRDMLRRCYSSRSIKLHPSYKNCEVCPDWFKLSKFVEDVQLLPGYEDWVNNPGHRIALDKDIRAGHHNIYSIQTCSFVSQTENTVEANRRVTNRNHYKGKPLKCTRNDGSTIIYENVGEAKKAGFNPASIRSCICGSRKRHKGCSFEYIYN